MFTDLPKQGNGTSERAASPKEIASRMRVLAAFLRDTGRAGEAFAAENLAAQVERLTIRRLS